LEQALTPLQKYGAQGCVGLLHIPFEHVPALVSVAEFAGHVAVEQEVPSAYFWQPPAPSHLPFVPHVVAPWSAQKAAGATVSAATGEQVPLPERLQAWQGAQLTEPQQTPSTQLPLMHWPPVVQERPFFLSAQLMAPAVPWHVNGATQSPSPAQVILQAFGPQT
jgi:hypothetical protein